MIPKKLRAPKEIFSKKPYRQVLSSHFRIKIFPNNLNHNRFSSVVGVKTDRSSAGRHFLKRLIMSAAMRENGIGKDVVIITNPNLKGIPKEEIKKELETVFKKINSADEN